MKAGPQDLPTSQTFLIYTVTSYALVSFLLALFLLSAGQAFFAALVDTSLMVLLSYVILWMKELSQRWYQMLTAMTGASLVIALFALPLYIARYMVGSENAFFDIATLLIYSLLVWNLAIFTHIFRHTLNVPYLAALLFAGLYAYISIRIIDILFFTTEIGA